MAWQFHDQIAALTGFDADSSSNVESGETYRVMTGQWLTDAAKEVINMLPPLMLERCSKVSSSFVPTTGVATESKVVSVQRALDANFTTGQVFTCRQIPHTMSYKAADVDSIESATVTDPVFYYEPQTDGTAVKVKVLPSSTASVAKTITVDYPTITYTESEIPNLPDEAEYLVLLKASITAAEYQAAIEEDPELYLPIIQNLKQDYMQGLQALGVVQSQPQQAGR